MPRHPIGWLFLVAGTGAALAALSHGYADTRLDEGGTLAELAACYANVSWMPLILPPITFLLLLFPDGRLMPGRWRFVGWLAAAGIALSFAGTILRPGPLEDYPGVQNPLAVPGAEAIEGLGFLVLAVALIGCPASLAVRFRRAGHLQRLQIKWLALSGALAAAAFVVGVPMLWLGAPDGLVFVPLMTAVMALPVTAAVAILRYRLYDIDVVVNRTLVYAALTATLAAAYTLSVLLLQLALSPLTEQSDAAIAASTLAVASLFGPARRRIQAAVDRRFYRRRFDAARTLTEFGARARDEVELDALATDLRTVVADTMQPTHVSLWLRP